MAPPSYPKGHAAAFSRCGRYRWWLSRRWRQDGPLLLFIGLNPSSADHRRDDATLRRLIGFAGSWGYGGIEVVNLFAWISADPAALRQAAEPVGSRSDLWIRQRVRRLLRHNATLADATSPAATALHAPAIQSRSGARRGSGGQPSDRDDRQPKALLPLWLGWGNGGTWQGRDRQVLQLLGQLPVRLFCLGHTAAGQPRHPLYVPNGSPLLPFGASWRHAPARPLAPCPASRVATRST